MFFFLGGVALLVAVILFFVARNQKGKLTDMAVVETYTVKLLEEIHTRIVNGLGPEAFQQRCEIKGVVECETPLSGPLSGNQCVAYRYVVRREYEEEVTETDSEGNRETKTKRGSEVVESQEPRVRFWVRDETGRVLVDPEGAEIEMKESGEHYEEETSGSSRRQQRRTLGYTSTESALEVGSQVYVLGTAVDFQDGPLVGRHPGDASARFFISWRTEEELTQQGTGSMQTYNRVAAGLGVAGVVLIVLGLIF